MLKDERTRRTERADPNVELRNAVEEFDNAIAKETPMESRNEFDTTQFEFFGGVDDIFVALTKGTKEQLRLISFENRNS